MHKVAVRQNVPDWLVTLRHDAAHGEMPAGHLVRNAMIAAHQWLIVRKTRNENTRHSVLCGSRISGAYLLLLCIGAHSLAELSCCGVLNHKTLS